MLAVSYSMLKCVGANILKAYLLILWYSLPNIVLTFYRFMYIFDFPFFYSSICRYTTSCI